MYELDLGIRCDNHIGETFPPRCEACDALTQADPIATRLGFIPGSSCRTHPGYPLPCAHCARDKEEI